MKKKGEIMGEGKEVTPGGSEVFRHDKLATDTPPFSTGDTEIIEAIQGHVAKHFGENTVVIHELVSPFIHLDLHVVPPSPERPFHTLVTCGMSERPMKLPSGHRGPDRIELVLCLPPDWNLDQSSPNSALKHWAVKMLQMIARLPHAVGSWLTEGHTVPNDEAGTPYAADTNMCCALLAPSLTTPDSFHTLTLPNRTTIRFLGLWFINNEEMQHKLQRGYEALLQQLIGNNCSELLHLRREQSLKKLTIPEDLFGSSFASRPARIKTRWQDIQRTWRALINPALILIAVGTALTASGIVSAKVSKPAPGMVIAGIVALVIAFALGLLTWKLIKNMRIVFHHGLLLPGLVVEDSESLLAATLVNVSHSGSQPHYVVAISSQMLDRNRALSLYKGAKVPVVCTFQRAAEGSPEDTMGRWAKVDLTVAQAGNSEPSTIEGLMKQFSAQEWEQLLRAVDLVPRPLKPGTFPVTEQEMKGKVPPPLSGPPPLPTPQR